MEGIKLKDEITLRLLCNKTRHLLLLEPFVPGVPEAEDQGDQGKILQGWDRVPFRFSNEPFFLRFYNDSAKYHV